MSSTDKASGTWQPLGAAGSPSPRLPGAPCLSLTVFICEMDI